MFGVERDFRRKDVSSFVELHLQFFGGHFLGQVLHDDVELGDQLGILDLPHQPEFLAVQLLLIFVIEGLKCFLLVCEIYIAESKTLATGEVSANFHT